MAGNPTRFASPMPVRDLIALTVVALVGAVSVWEIYAHPWLVVATAVPLAVAATLAWLAVRRRWRLWVRVLMGLVAYLVVGVAVAIPELFRDLSQAPKLLLGVLTAPVTGWKDILTLDLPLGVYQATLAPTVLLLIVLPYLAFQFAWGSAKWWPLAAPAMLLITVYGIAFGSSVMRPIDQMVIGLAAFLGALAWLVWRSSAIRRRALRIAETSAVGSSTRRVPVARILTGFGVIAAATTVGMLVAPTLVSGQARDVLRTGVDPELVVQQRITPLTTYRDFFSDERYDEVLIRVDAPAEVTRVKLATLAQFDGAQMHVARNTDGRDGAFIRVPSSISQSDTLVDAIITVEGYRHIWVPLAGDLHSIDFHGTARSALSDGFFYQVGTGTGVQLAADGLEAGDTIHETVDVRLGTATDVETFTPARQGPSLDQELIPEALTEWVTSQGVASTGAGLVELVERMRERGMLSHALTLDGATPAWVTDLGEYRFAPSRAGHSTDRINRLFTELLDREEAAGPNASSAELVAASGDDEQFAVAAALIADSLGFDARVAVGFRLAAPEDVAGPIGVAPCMEGECRGSNVAAWLEVRDAQTGRWAELVTTPQHTNSLALDLSQRSDPKNPTGTDEESAELVPPLEANPSDATEHQEEDEVSGPGLAWLMPALRIAGISLLSLFILASPFILIVVLKGLRRRARRRLEYPSDSVAAAWEEFVDTSIDHGLPIPSTHTRSEVADLYVREGSNAPWLAAVADHADYSAEGAESQVVEPYWATVAAERDQLRRSAKPVARLRAAISLRSLRYWFDRVKQRADILDTQRRTGLG